MKGTDEPEEHLETLLIHFDTHGSLSQTKKSKCIYFLLIEIDLHECQNIWSKWTIWFSALSWEKENAWILLKQTSFKHISAYSFFENNTLNNHKNQDWILIQWNVCHSLICGRFKVSIYLQVLRYVEHKFGGRKLPEGELVKLADRSSKQDEITLSELRDLILHVLDTAANLSLFLDIYTPACAVYHQQLFEIR